MNAKTIFFRIAIGFGLIVATVVGLKFSSLGAYLKPNNLIELASGIPDNLWVFLLFQLAYVLGSWLLFPLTATTIIALIVFPLGKAILAAFIGIFLSSSLTYVVGRWGLPIAENPRYRRHLDVVKEEVESYGYWAIGALRLGPQPPFVATSILAGALKVNFTKYLLATYLGLLPMMVLTFIFGQQAIELMKDPSTVAISTLLAMGILVPIYIYIKKAYLKNRKVKKKTTAAESSVAGGSPVL